MNETQQILVTELEGKVSKLSVNKNKKSSSDVRTLEEEVSKLSLNKDKKVKKELSSDIKILEDKKNKPIQNILCGFPLITKKGKKCTNKGLSECGGRCKMHNGK